MPGASLHAQACCCYLCQSPARGCGAIGGCGRQGLYRIRGGDRLHKGAHKGKRAGYGAVVKGWRGCRGLGSASPIREDASRHLVPPPLPRGLTMRPRSTVSGRKERVQPLSGGFQSPCPCGGRHRRVIASEGRFGRLFLLDAPHCSCTQRHWNIVGRTVLTGTEWTITTNPGRKRGGWRVVCRGRLAVP